VETKVTREIQFMAFYSLLIAFHALVVCHLYLLYLNRKVSSPMMIAYPITLCLNLWFSLAFSSGYPTSFWSNSSLI